MPRWTQDEDEFLRAHYETTTDQEIGEELGRSRSSVNQRRRRLGLMKYAPHPKDEGGNLGDVLIYSLVIRQVISLHPDSAKRLILEFLREHHYRSMDEMEDDDIVALGKRLVKLRGDR